MTQADASGTFPALTSNEGRDDKGCSGLQPLTISIPKNLHSQPETDSGPRSSQLATKVHPSQGTLWMAETKEDGLTGQKAKLSGHRKLKTRDGCAFSQPWVSWKPHKSLGGLGAGLGTVCVLQWPPLQACLLDVGGGPRCHLTPSSDQRTQSPGSFWGW